MSTRNVKDFSRVFSERIRSLRGQMGKSAFARKIGINNPSTYQNYEAGRVPDAATLQRIVDSCGVKDVTVDWLLGRDPGVVLTNMDSSSESRFIDEATRIGEMQTAKTASAIQAVLSSMRQCPVEAHQNLRQAIETELDRYQQWCEANYPNERIVCAHKVRSENKEKV